MNISDFNERGKAAEYLVAADLILQGIPATIIHGAWPYDVLAEIDGKTIRVQVKSTVKLKSWAKAKNVYRFGLRNGKHGTRRICPDSVDVVAFVALDIRRVAYFHISELTARTGYMKQTVDLRISSSYEGRKYSNGTIRKLDWHQTFDGKDCFRECLAKCTI